MKQDTVLFSQDKSKYVRQMAKLWQEAFGDGEAYIRYYFSKRIADSSVMLAVTPEEQLLSMIHVNPIHAVFEEQVICIPYIVGVATKVSWQRRGLMRQCMNRVLSQLKEQGYPFVVLMTERQAYYRDFGFQPLFQQAYDQILLAKDNQTSQSCFDGDFTGEWRLEPLADCYMEQAQRFARQYLNSHYDVYVKHDTDYLHRMKLEYRCQNGDVLLLIDGSQVAGMLFYAREEDRLIIQECLCGLTKKELYFLLLSYLGVVPLSNEMPQCWSTEKLPVVMAKPLNGKWKQNIRVLFTDWI